MAATGRATTKTAEPSAVATRQAGRMTTASTVTVSGPLFSDARAVATLPKQIASTQIVVTSLAFISRTFSDTAHPVEHILVSGSIWRQLTSNMRSEEHTSE